MSGSIPKNKKEDLRAGKLRIADHWNAISIIGLLSFWTVGQNLSMTCCGADGNTYKMTMTRDSPDVCFMI